MLKFKPWSETLLEKRENVMNLIGDEFNLVGFPIPIIKGRLNAIVAPSHSGKTIYALGLAFQLARSGYKVVFLSTEEDEESIVEKTIRIPIDDEAFTRIAFYYQGQFNKDTLTDFVKSVSNEGYDFLIIDYLKKSMWEEYKSDHVVMEEINSTILKTMASLEHKISTFAFVQGNREAFEALEDDKFNELKENPSEVALLIDGGMPVYRSADNLLFIRARRGVRTLLIAKSRRNNSLLGRTFNYNVRMSDFSIKMNEGK